MVELGKDTANGEEYVDNYLSQKDPMLLNRFNQRIVKEEMRAEIDRKNEVVAGWVERGSGWAIHRIKAAYLHIGKHRPIKGGAYIPLPPKLQGKQAIINIKNKDDECLRWALKAWRFPAKNHCDRPSQYPTEDGFDFTGVSFPIYICEIPKVEKLNNIAINVLGWD